MYTLHEREANEDITRLDAAWDHPDTFVFLHDKSGLPAGW